MRRSILAASALALGVLAVTGCAASQHAQSPVAAAATPTSGCAASACASGSDTITTQATGHATATPNILDVTMGVDTRAATARAALSANNVKTTALARAFMSSGVAPKDLQTAGLSIDPTYGHDDSTITGYEVTNSVHVTLRNLKTAGGLIDSAATKVGNAVRIDDMSFSVADDSTVSAKARTNAVTTAQQQAQQIAQAAGTKLGAIHTITERPAQLDEPSFDAAAAVPAARAVPILAGQLTTSVTIQVVYDIG
jgi:uncharacterized protein YggE